MPAAIPLGGYVLDQGRPVPAELEDQALLKPPSQRIAIAAAGPVANFIFAIFAYWLISVVGVTVAPIVGEVALDNVAERAGLQEDMEILGVDGRQVTSWRDVNMRLLERQGSRAFRWKFSVMVPVVPFQPR